MLPVILWPDMSVIVAPTGRNIPKLFEGAGDLTFLARYGTEYQLGIHIGNGRYATYRYLPGTNTPGTTGLAKIDVTIPNQTAGRDNAGITYAGTWANYTDTNSYGGIYKQTVTIADYLTFTTPENTTKIGARICRSVLGGFVVCYINNDSTLCTSLRTVQSYVNDGTLTASVLIANGGQLYPTDRVHDSYQVATNSYNDVALLAENLTPGAYTVKIKLTPYKNVLSTGVRLRFSGIAYVTTDLYLATNANSQWRTHCLSDGGIYDYVFVSTANGGYCGNDHGYDIMDTWLCYLNGGLVTPADGYFVFGASAQITRTSHLQKTTNFCNVNMQWIADPVQGLRSCKVFNWVADTILNSANSFMGMFSTSPCLAPVAPNLIDKGSNTSLSIDYALTAHDDTFKANGIGHGYAWDADGDIAVMHYVPNFAQTVDNFSRTDTRKHDIQDRIGGLEKIYLTYTDGVPDVTMANGTVTSGETQYRVQRFPSGANAALARQPIYTISGMILDNASSPVPGVLVTLGSYSAITDTNGAFTITGILAGTSGNLTPSKVGYVFAPEITVIPAMAGNLIGKNAIASMYLLDNFNGSGAITAHVPDYLALAGQAWNILSGTWSNLSSSQLKNATGNWAAVAINCGFSDFELIAQATFKHQASGIAARCDIASLARLVLRIDTGSWHFDTITGVPAQTNIYAWATAPAIPASYWVKWYCKQNQHMFWYSVDGITYTFIGRVVVDTDNAYTSYGFSHLFTATDTPFDSIQVKPCVNWKTLSLFGDSITVTYYGTGWACKLVSAYNNQRVLMQNYAVGGSKIVDGVSKLNDQVALAASDNADLIIIASGTNDSTGPENMAAITAEMASALDTLHSTNPNAKIWVVNVWPRWSSDGVQANMSNIRTAITTAWSTRSSWVTLLDVSTDPWFLWADTPDGVHPTEPAGYQKIANRFLPLLA